MTQTGSLDNHPVLLDLSAPHAHRYPVLIIHLTLVWYLHASVSLRGAVLVLATFLGLFQRLLGLCLCPRLPCFQTIRTWLLRLGLFVLTRALPRRDDWIFILDHTIQLGVRKCLLILGVPRAHLIRSQNDPENPSATTAALRHQDIVVLDLRVLAHCTGETVAADLQGVADRVGTPVQILSDHGSDVACGVRLFVQQNPGVVDTYDVTHQLALLARKELEGDPDWLSFVKQCTATRQALQQTLGAFLRPPAPRTRARYLNLEPHIDWALHVLAWSEQVSGEQLAELLGRSEAEARVWLEQKVGWLRQHREQVESYARLRELIAVTQQEVKVGGLNRQTATRVWEQLPAEVQGDGRWQSLLSAVRAYLESEGNKVPLGQTWLGTSDIIESLFGQYKWLLEKSPAGEIGISALLLPLLTVEWTAELVHQGLQAVGVETLRDWQEEQVGRSTLSKVREMRQVFDRQQAERQKQQARCENGPRAQQGVIDHEDQQPKGEPTGARTNREPGGQASTDST